MFYLPEGHIPKAIDGPRFVRNIYVTVLYNLDKLCFTSYNDDYIYVDTVLEQYLLAKGGGELTENVKIETHSRRVHKSFIALKNQGHLIRNTCDSSMQ